MSVTPALLETRIDWRAADVADPRRWTVTLTDGDVAELDAALGVAREVGGDLLDLGRESFPLAALAEKLADVELPPGSMQFINNYHVLHGRTPYEDDVAAGYKRHLKRLWLGG